MARARLPDEVFRQIMLELDAFSLQYGSTAEHRNEEARFRFLSAVSSFIFLIIRAKTYLLIVISPSISISPRLFSQESCTIPRKPF